MNLQEEFYNKLDHKKLKINWNKNPIEMKLFLSFLTVELERSRDHLGSNNGWTRHINKERKLIVCGGIVKSVEYLDNLQFGEKLSNPYNNYVNPFYLFEILSEEGKKFFANYYQHEIGDLLKDSSKRVAVLTNQLKIAKELKFKISEEVLLLLNDPNQVNKH